MRKKGLMSIVFLLVMSLTLFACKKDEPKVSEKVDLSKVDISIKGFKEGDSLTSVTGDFELPVTFENGVTATWESDKDAVAISGKTATVTQTPGGDVKVKLTATLKQTLEGEAEQVLKRDPIEVTIKKLDYTPTLEGLIYHWMPNSTGASVTATVNLFGVEVEEAIVSVNGTELVEGLEFEIVDDVLELFGDFLVETSNELGEYTLTVETDHGVGTLKYHVVNDPKGTSIPTKEIEVSDMGSLEQANITEPIAGAPKLMITEVAADAGKHSYVEVFNNSKEKVNLKGHMLVWGALEHALNQTSIIDGLISLPMGTVPFYINEDMELEPFETGIIWHIHGGNRIPWDHGSYAEIVESDTAKPWLFDWQGGNLTEEGFRKEHGIPNETKVVYVRGSQFSINNTTAHNEDGFGLTVWRGGGFGGVNSGTANRAVQLIYIDQTIKHEIHETDTNAPEGATYFKFEQGIINSEKDAYVDGVLDNSKLKSLNGTSATPRLSINTFYTRMAYYDKDNVLLGYDNQLNSANDGASQSTYANAIYRSVAVQSILSTAVVFPTFDENGAVARWGIGHGMEYSLPETGSHMMRFVPRSETADYNTFIDTTYTNLVTKEFVKLGLGNLINEFSNAKKTVTVPVDNTYAYEIPVRENSAGVTSKYNLGIR